MVNVRFSNEVIITSHPNNKNLSLENDENQNQEETPATEEVADNAKTIPVSQDNYG